MISSSDRSLRCQVRGGKSLNRGASMNHRESGIQVLYDAWPEYELLDSGHYRKLERFGKNVISRSEPRAWWAPDWPETEWQKAVATCNVDGQWEFPKPIPSEWTLRYDRLRMLAKFSAASKHVGVFPEQSAHWQWIKAKGEAAPQPGPVAEPLRLHRRGQPGSGRRRLCRDSRRCLQARPSTGPSRTRSCPGCKMRPSAGCSTTLRSS